MNVVAVLLFAWLFGVWMGFIFCYADTKARAKDAGRSVQIIPMFAHYDCWIGFYWDKKKGIWYIFPFPMIGIRLLVRAV